MPTFSRSLEQSLHRALALANERRHEYATLEHLLLALLDQELPRQLVPDADALRAQAEAALGQKPRIQGSQQQPQISAAASRIRTARFASTRSAPK